MNSLRIYFAVYILLAIAVDAKASLIGVQWFSGNIYSIDETTGATTFSGNTGFNGLNSLAKDNSGTLYSVGSPRALLTISPTTGTGTAAATITGLASGHTVRGLTFSPSNQLFAVTSDGFLTGDKLYSIDTSTGAASFVGDMGFSGITGLDFDSSGTLYGWQIFFGLLTINTTTGVATDVNPAIGGGVSLQSIVFADDGSLYGLREDLYSISKSTGALKFIGSNGIDFRGVENLGPGVIPEPSTLTLAALGLVGIACFLRKRR